MGSAIVPVAKGFQREFWRQWIRFVHYIILSMDLLSTNAAGQNGQWFNRKIPFLAFTFYMGRFRQRQAQSLLGIEGF